MAIQDINSFFGNAIDNAIDYLVQVDEDKRFVRITSSQQGSILSIRIENFCAATLVFQKSGLPLSTKEDNGYHGFGTKSIRNIAEKYNGSVSFSRQDDLFVLTAIFMV